MKIVIYISAICLLFCACVHPFVDEQQPKPVDYSVVSKSIFFNTNNITFSIDTAHSTLFVKFKLSSLKNFPFPIVTKYKDTLTRTAFNFEFYSNNKVILSDYRIFKNTFRYYHDTLPTARDLKVSTDTINLKNDNELEFKIPFWAFHNLKKGKQTIEMAMWQTTFTDEKRLIKSDSNSYYIHLLQVRPMINARVKFDLNIPAIYKSVVIGKGLILQNDKDWSPVGMDNTIWKSSLPDIYWTIVYPQNQYYVQTPYEPSTDRYMAHDTFSLYHYLNADSVGFNVFDHDNLSRDDWMGSWWGSINELEKKEIKRLKFDHIRQFDVSVKAMGVIN